MRLCRAAKGAGGEKETQNVGAAAVPAASSDPSRIWLPELVRRFASSLTSNEVACALRLVDKATAAQCSALQHTTVRLSQPVPHHAFVWRWAGPDAMRTLARQQRLELPRLTARSGSIANLEVLLARDDLPAVLDRHVFRTASAAGQLDVCVWLKERGCTFQEWDAFTAAARGGHQAMCEWLLAADCLGVGGYYGDAAAAAAAAAAGSGQQVVCEWLLANGCLKVDGYCAAVVAAAAAEGGHVGLMDWLLLRADSTDIYIVLRGAAKGCDLPTLQRLHHTHVDTLPGGELHPSEKAAITSAAAGSPTADWQAKVEWLEARGYPRTEEACREAAAMSDALTRLQWLRQRGYSVDICAAARAARAGNAEALQYVLGQGVGVNDNMMWHAAAEGGHVAVLEVLRARGAVRMGEERVRTAAAAGHLPAVAWLVERLGPGAALTARVFAAAARAGSMELLVWLRARGCPWDAAVFVTAATEGSEEQLEWLVEQGCPMWDDGEPYVQAACHGGLAMLRCLRRLGCPWGPDGSTLIRAVEGVINDPYSSGEHVQRMLSWLLDQGCPVDWDALEAAACMEPRRAHKRQRSQSTAASPPQQRQPDAASDLSRIWLPEIVQRFAAALTSNEVAVALRLVNKATAAQFSGPRHTTVRLSQPVPHHAFVRRWAGPDTMRTLARQQRLELPRLTARSGSITNLEVLLARDDLPTVLDPHVFRAAAAAGQLDVCVWLSERGCPYQKGDALMAAAGGGHEAVCEWLLANGCLKVGDYCAAAVAAAAAAASGGHVGLMDWLLLRADSTDVYIVLRGAAGGCDLPTLQRLHHTHVDTLPAGLPAHDKSAIISAAAGSPTTDWQAKVEWLEARGYPRTELVCRGAATKPDVLTRLQWLRQRGYPLNTCLAASAARAGNVEVLQYVLGQGVEVDIDMMWHAAAEGGHVAAMEELHARWAVRMGEETVSTAAASSGHLPAVAWLVERLGPGAALTARVFAAAARAGSMELLVWLRARGCPWDATVFTVAAAEGSEEQLEWVVEQGCLMGDDGEPYVQAARHGDLATLRCLRRLGCPWGPHSSTLTYAVAELVNESYEPRGYVQRMLSWLLDQGCPVDWDALEAAAWFTNGKELVRSLQAQRKQQAQVGSGGLRP
ncbi:Ankyrin repeat domain-containing protein [Tetrabaena socialis]|uniref:Ankyrin repeat domain-containing protein n=1 Tax=Tetrabaena socialis TaxID=47790 RepID=A0A2J7ZU39_9CHLO|nr:Ankyrin repeat domain-containing protein [Tetrabaena socialis]|eukprot:PNH03750.1 Ankyrin repeat domain-containing protein [Tetrabaena socialis]